MFNIKHIIFSFCFILFIDTSSPFNININSSRRNFIAKSLASNGLINLRIKEIETSKYDIQLDQKEIFEQLKRIHSWRAI